MPQYLSNELAGTATGLTATAATGHRPAATNYHARVRSIRATITLAGQLTTDTLLFGTLPPGATLLCGITNASATLGAAATLAIGIAGATGKYRTAALHTAVETPALFGLTPSMDDAALAAEENVIGTIAAAALPGAGTLIVVLFYTMP